MIIKLNILGTLLGQEKMENTTHLDYCTLIPWELHYNICGSTPYILHFAFESTNKKSASEEILPKKVKTNVY